MSDELADAVRQQRAERRDALELMNAELQGVMDAQFSFGDKIDAKATLLVGFVAAAAQFLVTHAHRSGWLTYAAVGAYALAFVGGLVSLALRKYRLVPDQDLLVERYEAHLAADPNDIVRPLLGDLVGLRQEAVVKNGIADETKVRAWWVSLVAMAIGVILSVVSLWIGSTKHVERPTRRPATTHHVGGKSGRSHGGSRQPPRPVRGHSGP